MVVRISSQPSSGSFGSGLVPPLVCLSVYCLSGVSHELVHSSKYCVARRVCSSLRSFLSRFFFTCVLPVQLHNAGTDLGSGTDDGTKVSTQCQLHN